jgi:hypothetical protein
MTLFKFNPETLRSRTFWAGVMAIATAVTTLHGPEMIMGILSGLAAMFMRDAISGSQSPAPPSPAESAPIKPISSRN